jgi:hypothetical protein
MTSLDRSKENLFQEIEDDKVEFLIQWLESDKETCNESLPNLESKIEYRRRNDGIPDEGS